MRRANEELLRAVRSIQSDPACVMTVVYAYDRWPPSLYYFIPFMDSLAAPRAIARLADGRLVVFRRAHYDLTLEQSYSCPVGSALPPQRRLLYAQLSIDGKSYWVPRSSWRELDQLLDDS